MNVHVRRVKRLFLSCLLLLMLFVNPVVHAQEVPRGTIDRKAVVSRHNLVLKDPHSNGPTQVGNGHFAYGLISPECKLLMISLPPCLTGAGIAQNRQTGQNHLILNRQASKRMAG